MIHESGTFAYRVVVQRDPDNERGWIGRADSLRDPSRHPGAAGKQPVFTLEHGRINLKSTEDELTRQTNEHYKKWRAPALSLWFDVGPALAKVLQPGDDLYFHKEGNGDFALIVIRNESLVLALGAVVGHKLGNGLQVDDDPRQLESVYWQLNEELDQLEDPASLVFWIDLDGSELDREVQLLIQTARHNATVVIKAASPKASEKLLYEVYDKISRISLDSVSYYHVDDRYRDKHAWLDYVRRLPRDRPNDLYVSFRTPNEALTLCAGEEASFGDYYVRVERILFNLPPGRIIPVGNWSLV